MQECLRIDVVRHFEVIPRTAVKDLVALDRPIPNDETIKMATKIGPCAPVLQSSTLQAAETVSTTGRALINQGGSGQSLMQRFAKHLNPGSWKGPIGELGRQAIVGASGVLLGPEAVPFAEAGMQALKKTQGNTTGSVGAQSYTGNTYDLAGHPLIKSLRKL